MNEGQAAGLRSYARHRFGLTSGAMPVTLVILLGTALGSYGLGVLSPRVLDTLDPVMPVALTAVGVYLGVAFNLRIARDRRALTASSIRAAVSIGVVAAGIALYGTISASTLDLPRWFHTALITICAADDPLAVLLGGVALAFLRAPSLEGTAELTLQATGVAFVIAVAGWLLLARSAQGTEQRIFVIALLLLLGGASEYLSLSAVAGGLIAGLYWEALGGSTRHAIWRDVLYVQRPLIVLVLVVTGARLELTDPVVLALGIPYLLLRLLGMIAGTAVARRLVPVWPPTDSRILPLPGVVGLAFALNAVRAAGSDASIVISIVVIGVVGSELLAPLLKLPEVPE